MIRNYNGVKNRKAILYLRTLCEIKSENMKSLSDELKKEGSVSFYPHDMTELITFKSEEEISKYLQKTFFEEVNRYFRTERIRKDYFILFLVKFLNENEGVFPDLTQIELIENRAEKYRIATSKEERKSVEPLQMLLREILEFSEEIMDRKSEEIIENIFPHEYELYIHTKNLHGTIIWDREGRGDQSDYCFITSSITGGTMIIDCSFDGTVNVYKRCYSGYNRKIRMNTKEKANLISIHRELALLASEVGLKFESEVDYNKILRKM